MKRRQLLVAALVLAWDAGLAHAEDAATFDPSQLPSAQGKVAEYSLTAHSDVDGLILADGTEVHVPPHLGTQLVFAVKPGDVVTVRGLRARAIPMIEAMSVSNNDTEMTVMNNVPGGLGGPGNAEQPMTAQGHIKQQLHGPLGDLNGVLLEDGTIVRLPPPEAQRHASELTAGAPLYVEGDGFSGLLGRVVDAQFLGPDRAQLAQIDVPPPPVRGRHPLPQVGARMMPPPGPDAPPPPALADADATRCPTPHGGNRARLLSVSAVGTCPLAHGWPRCWSGAIPTAR